MNRRSCPVVCLLACCEVWAQGKLPQQPPGSFFPLKAADHVEAATFEHGQPLVGTTYFYWYDVETKSHVIDHDGTDALTTHPADMNDLTFRSVAWHKQQLSDMIDAGIDFLIPVYWGVPGDYEGWSFAGLRPLAKAHSELQKAGATVPSIGLFYDTSILQYNRSGEGGRNYHVDLSTEFGREWFYTAARDFFSMVEPSKWARVDSRPIVFLYSAGFAKRQDDGQLPDFKRRFKSDFGVEPFLVKSQGWRGPADAVYAWGGAVNGPRLFRHAAALGPGYDHSAVPGRAPLIVERNDGATYIERWKKLLRLDAKNRPWMVHVETWNEWHEGTDIAASAEYGRSYIVLTRLFADMWHGRTQIKVSSPYAEIDQVTWQPGWARGVDIRPSGGDGVWDSAQIESATAVISRANPHSATSRYLYFDVDDAFAFGLYGQDAIVRITYRDAGCSSFRLEYDSSETGVQPFSGAFRPVQTVTVGGSGQWRTAQLRIRECGLTNRCNEADLRLLILGGELELAVRELSLAAGPSQVGR